jgi:hypothetical protein
MYFASSKVTIIVGWVSVERVVCTVEDQDNMLFLGSRWFSELAKYRTRMGVYWNRGLYVHVGNKQPRGARKAPSKGSKAARSALQVGTKVSVSQTKYIN